MKRSLQWGAGAVLALIALPIVIMASRNGALAFPLWWGISHLVFSRTFPAWKQPSVPALAIQCGQLAWLLLETLNGGIPAITSAIQAALLLAGVVWLFVTQSRLAAVLLLLLQLATLLAGLAFLPQIPAMLEASGQPLRTLIPIVLNSIVYNAIAAYFLVRFLKNRTPQAQPAKATAAVFE